MDVVKSETAAVGGRISVATEAGQGATFRIHLPLTLAVTQALLVRAGGRTFAIRRRWLPRCSNSNPTPSKKSAQQWAPNGSTSTSATATCPACSATASRNRSGPLQLGAPAARRQ